MPDGTPRLAEDRLSGEREGLMAQLSSSGRGGTATATRNRPGGNRTPNTPEISESAISRLRVDDIRGQLRRRGVAGISALRKNELVKTLVRTLRAERRRGAPAKKTGPARKGAGAKKTGPARKGAAAKKTTAPARRGVTTARKGVAAKKITAPARKSATTARKGAAAKKTTAPARKSATTARKGAAAKKTTAPARKSATTARKGAAAKKTTAPARKSATTARKGAAAKRTTAGNGGGIRQGNAMSRSLKYAQEISSPAERPERPGRSLVTTDHEVIRRWAEARNATPATIEGTEHDGRPGVLTFNFPGWREGGKLRQISWDEWFRSFDARRVNFIYQEQKSNGVQSNFFRTESPDRQDA
jgi:hypothetical protein